MEQGKNFSDTESPLVDFDAVCQKVRAAVEPARAHAVSLHDENGDVLWLSESSMGPDEHNAVLEAIETFKNPKSPPVVAYDLGDARSAVLLRAVSSRRAMVGAIMLVLDTRVIKHDDHGAIRIMTPKLQRVLMDFAGMRPEADSGEDTEPAIEPEREPPPPPPRAASRPAAPGRKPLSAEPLAPSAPASKAAWSGSARPRSTANGSSAPRPANAQHPQPASARPAEGRVAPVRPSPEPVIETEFELSLVEPTPAPAARLPSTPRPAPVAPAAARPAPVVSAPAARPAPPLAAAPTARPAAAPAARPAPVASARVTRPQAAPTRQPAAQVTQAPPPPPIAPVAVVEPDVDEELEPLPPGVSPEIARLHAALRRSPIALHVQRLVPLTKGSQLRRYEVLLRSKAEDAPNSAPQAMIKAAIENGLGSMIDRRVVTELVGWLVRHPEAWQQHAVMFSVNLTTTALHDEHFIKFLGLCLAKSSLPKAMIAFEIDVSMAVKMSARIAEVAASLHRLGCPLVLDEFALKTECFELLRLPGVGYVKLAPDITAKMRTDKIAQASITAVVQMARVLGMHTVAKRMETAAEQEWLTALGVDFVQSNSMSPAAAIDTLAPAPRAKV